MATATKRLGEIKGRLHYQLKYKGREAEAEAGRFSVLDPRLVFFFARDHSSRNRRRIVTAWDLKIWLV